MQVLLGYEDQKLKIYINPFSSLNEFGERLKRENEFPSSYRRFLESGENPLDAISDLQRYIEQSENGKVHSRNGSAKSQGSSKRRSSIRTK